MTHSPTITPADRKSAANSSPHNERWGMLVRKGHVDTDPLVQAFATHRETHTAPLIEANLLRMEELHKERAESKLWFEKAQEWKARIAELEAALEDIRHQAETRIEDGDEMGARVWRIALVDILTEARQALEGRK